MPQEVTSAKQWWWKGMVSRTAAPQSRPTTRLPRTPAAPAKVPAMSFGTSLKGFTSLVDLKLGKCHQAAREGSVQSSGLSIPCPAPRRRSGAGGERGSAGAAGAGRHRFPLLPGLFLARLLCRISSWENIYLKSAISLHFFLTKNYLSRVFPDLCSEET